MLVKDLARAVGAVNPRIVNSEDERDVAASERRPTPALGLSKREPYHWAERAGSVPPTV
jgi:hypothetical protein